MSLRISSSPISNSCCRKPKEAYNFLSRTPNSRSITFTASSSSSFSSSARKMSLALPDPNLSKMILANRGFAISLKEEQKVRQVASIGAGTNPEGSGTDSNGGEIEAIDKYYQKIIEIYPGNSLLLGNYANFLKEVKRDYAKAEEYFGRAILVNPNDGKILSLFGDLIWQTQKDASRARIYYEQAVKAAPDDCYVMASYARFLLEVEPRGDI